MKYLLVTITFVFALQAQAGDGLDAAFDAALANSEKDHASKQVAFEVSPDQVEKATFKRVINPHVVDVPASVTIDAPSFKEKPLEETDKPAVEPKGLPSGDDMAALGKELSDIQ